VCWQAGNDACQELSSDHTWGAQLRIFEMLPPIAGSRPGMRIFQTAAKCLFRNPLTLRSGFRRRILLHDIVTVYMRTPGQATDVPEPIGMPNSLRVKSDAWPLPEALLVALLIYGIVFAEVVRTRSLTATASDWLDNGSYIQIARMIRNWRIEGAYYQHFWGLPAVIALVSYLTHLSELHSLLLISGVASLSATTLIARLYGSATAITFAVIALEWSHLSVMGGSEPLFVALLMASFLAFRTDKVVLASLFAAVATTVRPVGFLALLSFGTVLVARKDWSGFWKAAGTSTCVALGYLGVVGSLTGDPFVNLRLYSHVWQGGFPISYPLWPLVKSIEQQIATSPWTQYIQSIIFIVIAAVCAVRMIVIRHRFRAYVAESLFAATYLVFVTCYNIGDLAPFFQRLVIPALPTLLFSLQDRLLRLRRIAWPMAVLSGLLASIQFVGAKGVFGFSFHH
jgi:hypothetical protein